MVLLCLESWVPAASLGRKSLSLEGVGLESRPAGVLPWVSLRVGQAPSTSRRLDGLCTWLAFPASKKRALSEEPGIVDFSGPLARQWQPWLPGRKEAQGGSS